MSLKTFVSRNYSKLRHIPPTHLGYFDVHYHPREGKLKVELKFRIGIFSAVPGGIDWDWPQKLKVYGQFRTQIAEWWNGRFVIVCTKPGYEGLVAVPEFNFMFSQVNPHFDLQVYGKNMGVGNTAVRQVGKNHPILEMKGQSVGPNIATAVFNLDALNRWANASGQNDTFKAVLKRPLFISIGTHKTGGKYSFSTIALLKSFAEDANYAFSSVKLKHKPKLKITAMGTRKSDECNVVANMLRTFGVTLPIVTKSEKTFGSGNPPKEIKIEWENLEDFDRRYPSDIKSIPLTSQSTIAHEFGHMLGLPDEYMLLCTQCTDALTNLKMMSSASEVDTHMKNVNPEKKDPGDAISANQTGFNQLCVAAGLVPPPFGGRTSSLMSGGSKFAIHHCVTVWDALGEMTKNSGIEKKYWRIYLADHPDAKKAVINSNKIASSW